MKIQSLILSTLVVLTGATSFAQNCQITLTKDRSATFRGQIEGDIVYAQYEIAGELRKFRVGSLQQVSIDKK